MRQWLRPGRHDLGSKFCPTFSISGKMGNCVADHHSYSIVRRAKDAKKEISEAALVFCSLHELVYYPHLLRICLFFARFVDLDDCLINAVINIIQYFLHHFP